MVQPLRQLAQDLPLLGRFAVFAGRVFRFGAGHVGAPDGVDAEVFVEDHEEVVEPTLAETLVVELGVLVFGGGGLWTNE